MSPPQATRYARMAAEASGGDAASRPGWMLEAPIRAGKGQDMEAAPAVRSTTEELIAEDLELLRRMPLTEANAENLQKALEIALDRRKVYAEHCLWLQGRVSKLEEDLASAQQDMEAREDHHGQLILHLQGQLRRLEAELREQTERQVERQLAEAQAQVQSLTSRLAEEARARLAAEERCAELSVRERELRREMEARDIQHRTQFEARTKSLEAQVRRIEEDRDKELASSLAKIQTLEERTTSLQLQSATLLAEREQLQRDLDHSRSRWQDEQARVREAQARARKLEEQRLQRAQAVVAPIAMGHAAIEKARAVAREHMLVLRLHGELLPDCDDEFVQRVRNEQAGAVKLLEHAYKVHVEFVKAHVDILARHGTDKEHDWDSHTWHRKAEMDHERRDAMTRLQAFLHDFRATQHELRTQHQLSKAQMDVIEQRVRMMIGLVEEEMRELAVESLLLGLPQHILDALVDVHHGNHHHHMARDDDDALLHWLHRRKRRPLVHFLLHHGFGEHSAHEAIVPRSAGSGASSTGSFADRGRGSLDSSPGRARSQRAWSPDEVPLEKVLMAQDIADKTGEMYGVESKFRATMKDVDEKGWDEITWTGNFTLLHWAAKTSKPALCRKFLLQRADPNLRDSAGMTPLDYARRTGGAEVLQTLMDGGRGPSSPRLR